MKQLFYPLAFSLLMLGGCSKDDTAAKFAFAGNYQAATTIVAAPIAMYTKDGMVNNPALVDNLLRRRNLNASGYFSRTDVQAPGNSLKLTIGSDGKATFLSTYSNRTDTVRTTVTSQTVDYFILSNTDSISVIYPYNYSGISYRCNLLADAIKTAYPVRRCRAVSVSSGTVSQSCRFPPIRLIEIKGGQLFIPVFAWFVETGQPTECGTGIGGEWNTFSPAILTQLVAGDTIVVQTRSIALTKL